jgi:thymidylate synthase (FAD)
VETSTNTGEKMNHEDKNKTIYLYGDNIGKVQLIESWGSDLTVVNSARVSFGTNKKELDSKDKKLINYLIKHKHTSTLEHCGITFKFTVPLYIRSQHHRHRTWSYNEISRRYTEKDLQFYCPREFRTQHESNRQASNIEGLIDPHLFKKDSDMLIPAFHPKASESYEHHCQHSLRLFNELVSKGVCREQARGVLPQTLYTEYYGTTCLSNLFKFINLRLHDGAQWEIQKVAEACLEIALDLFPISTKAFIELNDNQYMKNFLNK